MDGLKRNLEPKIRHLLNNFPIVVILGVRQCGKSTLAKIVAPDWTYFDLENPNHFQRIHEDPVLFFQENRDQVIIDEAQKSPGLFEVLRGVVDSDRKRKGRFILTGSASFDLLKNISESLAGRVGLLELSPFKINELSKKTLPEFYQIFEKKISEKDLDFLKNLKPQNNIETIKSHLLRGGYPEPLLKNDPDYYLDWMENYFETYINRDMRTLFPRLDLIRYRRVVSMLSFLSGTIINKSEIARSIESSEKSTRDYMEIIEGTYFWRNLQAFTSSKIKTTVKLARGHFRDSGLTLFLQNIYTMKELDNYPRLGKVFEAFIIEEIIRGIEACKARNCQFYHFRTKAGGEIDLLAKGSFGLLPIEIKYQSYTEKKKLTSLINFVDLFNLPFGIVVNNSTEVAMITEKIIQIPVGCL